MKAKSKKAPAANQGVEKNQNKQGLKVNRRGHCGCSACAIAAILEEQR